MTYEKSQNKNKNGSNVSGSWNRDPFNRYEKPVPPQATPPNSSLSEKR